MFAVYDCDVVHSNEGDVKELQYQRFQQYEPEKNEILYHINIISMILRFLRMFLVFVPISMPLVEIIRVNHTDFHYEL